VPNPKSQIPKLTILILELGTWDLGFSILCL